MEPVGYYVDCDTAVCADDEPEDWPGFEDWAEPLAIFAEDESDTPTHCERCETVIPQTLTSEGYAYVREALARAMVGDGRRCIVRAWVLEYLEDDEDARETVEDWPETDDYSPGGPRDRRS